MSRKPSPYALIFLTVVIDLIGFGIVIPILPLYSETMGATPFQVGLLLAVFSVMQFVFSPVLGHWSDRVGRKPVLAFSVLGSSVAFLTMGLAGSLWVLFVARMFDGMTAGNISTAQAYIADITRPEERAKGVGLIGAGFGIGMVVGPLIGALAAHAGPHVPFFTAAALALVNSVAIMLFLPETRHPQHAELSVGRFGGMREVLGSRILRGPVTLYVIAVLAMTLVYASFSLYLSRRFSLGPSSVGYLFGGLGIIGVITQLRLIGGTVRRWGEVRVARVALPAMGLALIAAATLQNPVLFGIALVVYGVANGFNNTVLMAIVSRLAPQEMQGRVIGTTQGCAALARAVGPVIAGALFDAVAPGAPFVAAGCVALVAGGLAMLLLEPFQAA